jgi:hypothetical protein
MRTTFFEMRLLNDTIFVDNASYTWNGNGWEESKTEGEREQEKNIKE